MKKLLLILSSFLISIHVYAKDLNFSVGGRNIYVLSHNFVDRFGKHSLAGAYLSTEIEVIKNLFAGIGYMSGRVDGTLFDFENRFEHDTLFAKLSYKKNLSYWFKVYGGVDIGAMFGDYEFSVNETTKITSEHTEILVAPHLGVELYIPTRGLKKHRGMFSKFDVGLFFETGYNYASSFDTNGIPDFLTKKDEKDNIKAQGMDMKKIDFQGIYWAIGVRVIF